MTTRACITYTPDGQCLGHPEVDNELFPPLCPKHLEIFMPLIEAKARVLADQIVTERLMSRPRGRNRARAIRLRDGATLNEQDERTLAFLRGAA